MLLVITRKEVAPSRRLRSMEYGIPFRRPRKEVAPFERLAGTNCTPVLTLLCAVRYSTHMAGHP